MPQIPLRLSYNPETKIKLCQSPFYNYRFDGKTGEFMRWGKTFQDDPKIGALEIFDLEVSTICHGIGEGPCKHCYKSNTAKGENMSLATFQTIFNKLPPTLTQIAFGVGDLDANPDLLAMFEYCHNNDHNPGVIPNLTINGFGLTDEWIANFKEYCGGIAVSVYALKEVCYDAVARLLAAGIPQVTIHLLIAEETLDFCREVIEDVTTDPRLANLKALMFLTLKPKGKRNYYHTVKSLDAYREMINFAFAKGLNIGFDSCAAPTFLAATKEHPAFAMFSQMSESCESNRFSGYANVKGEYWHCSFTEGMPGWSPINLLEIDDFGREVWSSAEVNKFRAKLLGSENTAIAPECYLCPIFDLYGDEVCQPRFNPQLPA
jgi:MoaA/NifB/PqqE/SkfB family radical SAM enzyme